MRIRGQELEVDILEELEGYSFNRSRVKENKLQSCSPFREDSKPSFAVNLENGTWIDSGADLDHLKKGNFISLLALLGDTEYTVIEDYLIEKYGIKYNDADTLSLKLDIDLQTDAEFTGGLFYKYSEYLTSRGIDDQTQRLFNTNEDVVKGVNCIGIGWYDITGKIISIKYRGTADKKFWYVKNGKPIKSHVFALDLFIKHRQDKLWITEAEIDAMYLWSLGYRAVALGRGSVNAEQLDLIKVSGAKTIVIATDNDNVGHKLRDTLSAELGPYFNIEIFRHPSDVKDINDFNKLEDTDLERFIYKKEMKIKL